LIGLAPIKVFVLGSMLKKYKKLSYLCEIILIFKNKTKIQIDPRLLWIYWVIMVSLTLVHLLTLIYGGVPWIYGLHKGNSS
ncbi:hypothetical protein, partial [Paenibacillus dendritiformis]|uniref:hypothetical protein n=1 Tax=Paenibacillus dendritiformis TaxID=130049 RepID=UPI001C268BCA